MNVVLVGYRGCGKTTIGKRLADRMWTKFVDVDDLIVKKAGKNIKQIFEEDGEEHFRNLETESLRELLALPDHVLSLGGGTVIRDENRRMIKESGAKVVYLRCEPDELLKRIQSDPKTAETRPSLTALGGNIEEIKLKLTEREPFYREVKHAELDVTNTSPEDAVVWIARVL
jgi:shikimate kinase